MKDEVSVAPKNQLILNVMITPLGIISLMVSRPRIVKCTSRDPCTIIGSSWGIFVHYLTILCNETSYLFTFGIVDFRELCGIANTL